MKIAVVGCGAVGSYYGAMLCREGQDVHFLLRSDYEVVRREGISVRSPAGDFKVRPHAAGTPEEIGPSDLVLIGLKTTANDQFPKLLPPLVESHTAVLTLQNGLGNEEALETLFLPEQIMGGLCFVCLNRVGPGIIHHLAHGMVMLGEHKRPSQPRTHQLGQLFERSGVPCKVTNNLDRVHWEKLVWNIPFNGLGVAGAIGIEPLYHPDSGVNPFKPIGPCLTTDLLLNDPAWERTVRELMHEVISVAGALGLEIPIDVVEQQISRTRTMGAYKASTLLDFECGRPLELESLFLLPYRAAERMGVHTPRLAALCRVLRGLESRRSAPVS